MVNLVNLTPHTLRIFFGNPEALESVVAEWPSMGLARVEETLSEMEPFDVAWPGSEPGTSSCRFPVAAKRYGAIHGLPEPQPDTIYVVSLVVLQALAGSRSDVYAPDSGPASAVRDKGQIIGVLGLMQLAS